ncbi:MAG: glycosyltransferase involved in cell wall biosynthesis [Candidatus Azotimanducaceae bacterium]
MVSTVTRHILQISHDYGGPFVTVCRQYVDAFPDDKVTTIFLRGGASPAIVSGVGGEQVQFIESLGEDLRGFKVAQIVRLYRLVKEQSFDLVIAHRYKAIYLAGIVSYFLPLPRLLGIAHEHNVFRRVTRKLFVTFWRRQYLIAGVSDSVTQNIASYCPGLVAEQRLFTLPNALPQDFESQQLTKQQAREALGLSPDSLVIGTIGRLVEKKSLHTLIEAFATAALSGEVTLVLMGEGPLRSNLEQLAVSLGIEERVRFLGHVPNGGHYVAAFDVFVLPSGIEEAFGIVLLEAMMAKVPVISSDAPGPKQVVGKTDWLFAAEDAAGLAKKMQAFFELHLEARIELGQSGYARVQAEYTHEQFCRRLSQLALFSD